MEFDPHDPFVMKHEEWINRPLEVDYNQFIGIYPNLMPPEWCEHMIKHIDFCEENTVLMERRSTGDQYDNQLFVHDLYNSGAEMWFSLHRQFTALFNEQMFKAVMDYKRNCGGPAFADAIERTVVFDTKFQKTRPGEGFHNWHFESDSLCHGRRMCAVSLYLNDIDEGGETEFLHQHLRIKPQAGMGLIWPAGYTHTHRGNPPLNQTKYILTTWLQYVNPPI